MTEPKIRFASCHCGAVRLRLTLPDGVDDPRRCNCSYCGRRGAIVATVLPENLEIVRGEEALKLYQFNTNTARHHFCSNCGIYTHHRRRSNPNEFGFNVGCLEDFDVASLGDVPTTDGINHPSDRADDSE